MVETTHAHRENPAHAAFEAYRMQAGKKQAHSAKRMQLSRKTCEREPKKLPVRQPPPCDN